MATTNFENAELNLVIIDKDGIAISAFLRQSDDPIGGIGGSIADQQVAFGNATDIAGSEKLKWNDASLALTFSTTAATSGNIRVPNGFSITGRNGNDDGNIPLLNCGDTQILIGDNSTGFIKTRQGGGHEFQIQSADDGGMSIVAAIDNLTLNAYVGLLNLAGAAGVALYGPATFNDVLTLTPMAEPSSPVEGMIYAGTDHHLYYYNGTTWKQLDN